MNPTFFFWMVLFIKMKVSDSIEETENMPIGTSYDKALAPKTK